MISPTTAARSVSSSSEASVSWILGNTAINSLRVSIGVLNSNLPRMRSASLSAVSIWWASPELRSQSTRRILSRKIRLSWLSTIDSICAAGMRQPSRPFLRAF